MAEVFVLGSLVAHQWHCDHFGHLNTRHYTAAFDDALFMFWQQIGIAIPRHGEPGSMPVTAEMKTSFKSEAIAGTVASVHGMVRRVGGKSVTLEFEMTETQTKRLIATCEVVEVFFDMQARASRPISEALKTRLLAAL